MYYSKAHQIIGLKTKTVVLIWNSVSQELGQDMAGWFSVPRSMGQGLHVASDRLGWEIPKTSLIRLNFSPPCRLPSTHGATGLPRSMVVSRELDFLPLLSGQHIWGKAKAAETPLGSWTPPLTQRSVAPSRPPDDGWPKGQGEGLHLPTGRRQRTYVHFKSTTGFFCRSRFCEMHPCCCL